MKQQFIIKDWAGNEMFDETFSDFDDAWSFLTRKLEQRFGIPQSDKEERAFDVELGEYQVLELYSETQR